MALAILTATSLFSARAQPHTQTIPSVHTPAFDGNTVDLPAALKGKLGILVVGFSQNSRDQVTDWSKRLEADYRTSTTVTYYQITVLEDVPRPLRSFVAGKVRESIPDVARPHSIPIVEHEAEWKAVAGYSAPDNAYLVIVDEHGVVRARLQGPITDKTYAQLRSQLASLHPTS